MARPVALVREFSLAALERHVDASRREIQRSMRMSGYTWAKVIAIGFHVWEADRAAVLYGFHPWVVWDNWFSTEDVLMEEAV